MTLNSTTVISQLTKLGISNNIVSGWFEEYKKLKNELLKQKWADCIQHSGLFSEYTVAMLKELYGNSKININKIHFDSFYDDCIKKTKPNPIDEILLLAVPHAAKTVYTIRNKKKGAHVKAINPDYVDSIIVSSLCDYIVSQFILLKCKGTEQEVHDLIQNIIEKKIPLIEEFEDGTIIIHEDLKNPDKILLALYKKGNRLTQEELIKILQISYSGLAASALSSLTKRSLVHKNSDGFKITTSGEKRVEEIVANNLQNNKK